MNAGCLERGLFSKETLKPIEEVFDYEDEKRRIFEYLRLGEWFTVCGLRRTGKTTLLRSVAATVPDAVVLYVDMWDCEDGLEYEFFMERLKEEIERTLKGRLSKVLERISGVSFFGVSVDLKYRAEMSVREALDRLAERKRVILIIDEAQKALKSERIPLLLASLHDRLGPRLSVAMAGSVISIRSIASSDSLRPLYGRLVEEILLTPWDEARARGFLRAGFEECGLEVEEEVVDVGVSIAGGFAGWLSVFGRLSVIEMSLRGRIDVQNVVRSVEKEAAEQVYDEVARFLRGRKNVRGYLKLLRAAAEQGFVSVSEAGRLLGKRPSTALFYLEEMVKNGLLRKSDVGYVIPDPLLRRLSRRPEFEREVKVRI